MILEVRPFQEVIVSHADHEANLYPWVDLVRERNIADDVGRVTYGKKSRLRDPDYANKVVLKTWTPDTTSESCSPTNPKLLASSLIPLLSKNTRLVCLPHVSNILGTIHDVRSICDIVRKYNRDALVCVDGVAYAPHRPLDVRALGVDIYAFSWHKTFGPHLAQVYISPRARSDLKIGYYPRRIGNQYHLRDTLETKIGLSGASDELVCAIPAVVNYLRQQGRWAWIVKHETELQETLLAWLRSREDVTVWGETDGTRAQDRVATVSFTVRGWRSKDIVRRVAEESGGKVGIWAGSFKSYELTHTVLKLDPMDGVVRVSMVHYNTGRSSRCPWSCRRRWLLTEPQSRRLSSSSPYWRKYWTKVHSKCQNRSCELSGKLFEDT
jgi:selenocysteine lyase/cysteine desulfurase